MPSPRWKCAGEALQSHVDFRSSRNQTFERQASLVVFGGMTASSARLGDLWLFTPALGIWQELAGASTLQPAPREAHTATAYFNTLYVLGGRTDAKPAVGDFWKITIVDDLSVVRVLQPNAQRWLALASCGVGSRAK